MARPLYEKLVYVAYGYFIVLGLAWLLASLFLGHYFNYWAFLVVALFSVQAYFRKKLTNLILGVLILGVSIFAALEFGLGDDGGLHTVYHTLLALSLISLVMSIILIFSYTKLSFGDQ